MSHVTSLCTQQGTCHKLGHAHVIGMCRGFTTLSAVLGMMTMYTHEGLLQALASETNSAAQTAMLRFAAVLFGMTPYQRLPHTLLPRILQVCSPLQLDKWHEVLAIALACIHTVFLHSSITHVLVLYAPFSHVHFCKTREQAYPHVALLSFQGCAVETALEKQCCCSLVISNDNLATVGCHVAGHAKGGYRPPACGCHMC